MTRFVYIVGNFSQIDDIELRYSLRSVAKYHPKAEVTIVGWKPDWCEPDRFIPYADQKRPKGLNTFHKLKTACEQLEQGCYVLMCDDFMLLRPHLHTMYYFKTLKDRVSRSSSYSRELFSNTMKLCSADSLCFDTHNPMTFESGLMLSVLNRYERNLGAIGLSYQTLYGNIEHRIRKQPSMNSKVSSLTAVPVNQPCISTNDGCFTDGDNRLLKGLYPNKSKWEK